MIAALARVPVARLTRTRRAWFPIVGWALFAIVSALSTRSIGLANGADHVMRGTFGFVILPLLTYGIVSATMGGVGLRPAVSGLVALGAEPRKAALASVVVSMVASAIVCGVIAMVVCLLAHGSADPPLAWDLPASFGVAFAGGAAYAAFFCAGSAFGRGAMRGVFLAIDYVIGTPAGFASIFTPRAHVMSLLGGAQCFELSRRASSVFLVVLALAYLALAASLARRAK